MGTDERENLEGEDEQEDEREDEKTNERECQFPHCGCWSARHCAADD